MGRKNFFSWNYFKYSQYELIEEFIFNGFLMLTSVVFGIATAGRIFNKNEKKEEKDAIE